MAITFWNGKFVPEEEILIPITDRGFLFGDGVFSTLKVVDGYIESYEAHLQRLYEGAWRMKIIVTGGNSSTLDLSVREPGHVLMALKSYDNLVLQDYKLKIYPEPIHKPTAKLKSLAYIDRLYVKQFACQHGYDDALVLSSEGFLLETAFANLFWMNGDELFVPHERLPFLSGIALENVVKIGMELGLKTHRVCQKPEDISGSNEVYVCNALIGIQPVSRIEDRLFSLKAQSWKKLQLDYSKHIKVNSLSCF